MGISPNLRRPSAAAIALAGLLGAGLLGAARAPAQEPLTLPALKLPDWSGQWIRTGSGSFDPTKPAGRGQQAPLTAEYQKMFEASLAAQAAGGQGNDPMARCWPPGMPRMMINYGLGMEFVLTPETSYLLFGEPMRQLRRIYTDARAWPAAITPTFSGYSIGGWEGSDGRGHYAVLAVETRGLRGPRSLDSSGIPVAADEATITHERMFLDGAKPDVLYDEITVIDHALTRPWTVKRTYRRERHPDWLETICGEVEPQVRIGAEDYDVTPDGVLMPTRKGQPPPDLRNFR
jgi:hypothetical protein